MINAQRMQDRYKNGVAGAGQSYEEGIKATTKDPIQLAIAAEPKWAQRVQEAAANGAFSKGLQKTSKAQWAANAVAAKSKFTGSSQLGAMKFGQYAAKAAPIIASIQQEIAQMPNVTEADMEARMIAASRMARERLKNL